MRLESGHVELTLPTLVVLREPEDGAESLQYLDRSPGTKWMTDPLPGLTRYTLPQLTGRLEGAIDREAAGVLADRGHQVGAVVTNVSELADWFLDELRRERLTHDDA